MPICPCSVLHKIWHALRGRDRFHAVKPNHRCKPTLPVIQLPRAPKHPQSLPQAAEQSLQSRPHATAAHRNTVLGRKQGTCNTYMLHAEGTPAPCCERRPPYWSGSTACCISANLRSGQLRLHANAPSPKLRLQVVQRLWKRRTSTEWVTRRMVSGLVPERGHRTLNPIAASAVPNPRITHCAAPPASAMQSLIQAQQTSKASGSIR